MKTFKFLLILLSLAALLPACNLPGGSSLPTQAASQKPVGPFATATLYLDPTQTEIATTTSTSVALPIQPNTPIWSVYNYTCELAAGGGTITMNLAWTDHSNSEEGYKVYRDRQVIATLAPNSTSYVDIAFVVAGDALSYAVEAFGKDWQVSTRTITHGCQ